MLPNHRLKKAIALALALGAIVPATATAKPVGPDPSGASFTIPQTPSSASPPPPAGLTGATRASAPPAASRSRCWASAEGLLISQRRPRRTRRTTGLPS